MEENNAIVVSEELMTHYNKVLKFQEDLLAPEKNILTKNSDISTAMNATTRLLSTINKELTAAPNAENFAAMKQILISTLKEVDVDVGNRFIAALKEKNLDA